MNELIYISSVQGMGILTCSTAIFYIHRRRKSIRLRHQHDTSLMTHLNLYVADLIYAGIGLPVFLFQFLRHKEAMEENYLQYMNDTEPSHPIVRKAMFSIMTGTQYAMQLAVIPLVWDRVIAVTQPYRFNTSYYRTTITWMIGGLWATAALFSVGTQAVLSVAEYRRHVYSPSLLLLAIAVVFFLLPFVFVVISSSVSIYFIIFKSNRQIDLIITVLKVILIILLFTISWLPWSLDVLVTQRVGSNTVSENILNLSFLYLNTVTDPLVYLIPNRFIKKFLRKIFLTRRSGQNLIYQNPLPVAALSGDSKFITRNNDCETTVGNGIQPKVENGIRPTVKNVAYPRGEEKILPVLENIIPTLKSANLPRVESVIQPKVGSMIPPKVENMIPPIPGNTMQPEFENMILPINKNDGSNADDANDAASMIDKITKTQYSKDEISTPRAPEVQVAKDEREITTGKSTLKKYKKATGTPIHSYIQKDKAKRTYV